MMQSGKQGMKIELDRDEKVCGPLASSVNLPKYEWGLNPLLSLKTGLMGVRPSADWSREAHSSLLLVSYFCDQDLFECLP